MRRILLVEDDPDGVEIVRTMLEHGGYAVATCTDGSDAVRCTREQSPDLILMALGLPRIDGWQATRMLKADPVTRSVPIIALTAQVLGEQRERAVALGFDGYLMKPIAPREVLAAIEEMLSGEPLPR